MYHNNPHNQYDFFPPSPPYSPDDETIVYNTMDPAFSYPSSQLHDNHQYSSTYSHDIGGYYHSDYSSTEHLVPVQSIPSHQSHDYHSAPLPYTPAYGPRTDNNLPQYYLPPSPSSPPVSPNHAKAREVRSRRRFDYKEKAAILQFLEIETELPKSKGDGTTTIRRRTYREMMKLFKVSMSMLSDWNKSKDKIFHKAGGRLSETQMEKHLKKFRRDLKRRGDMLGPNGYHGVGDDQVPHSSYVGFDDGYLKHDTAAYEPSFIKEEYMKFEGYQGHVKDEYTDHVKERYSSHGHWHTTMSC